MPHTREADAALRVGHDVGSLLLLAPARAMTFSELDTVVLRERLPASGLEAGDVGAVVESHRETVVVEFVTGCGATQALLTLATSQVRTIGRDEILCARRIGPSEGAGTSVSIDEIRFDNDSMWVRLADGRTVGAPLVQFPRLLRASPSERDRYTISPRGLHWEELDEDVSLDGLLDGTANGTTLRAPSPLSQPRRE